MLPPIDTIIENFEIVEDDDMRLEYLIELGRALPPMPEAERTETNRVHGCESQVWIDTKAEQSGGAPRLVLHGFFHDLIRKVGVTSLEERLTATVEEELSKNVFRADHVEPVDQPTVAA